MISNGRLEVGLGIALIGKQDFAQALQIFDASLAMEMICFLSPDAKEGVDAVRNKRPAKFPSANPSK